MSQRPRPKRPGGFDHFEALRAVRQARCLDVESKALLAMLLTYTNEHGECWPSLRRLALDTSLSFTTVKERKSRLERLGVLRVEHLWHPSSTGRVSATSNCYQLDLAALQRLAVPSDHDPETTPGENSAQFPVEK